MLSIIFLISVLSISQIYGQGTPGPTPGPPTTPIPKVVVQVDFTFADKVYSVKLEDPTSTEYITLAAEVEGITKKALENKGYTVIKVTVTNFAPGSVKATTKQEIKIEQNSGVSYDVAALGAAFVNNSAFANISVVAGPIMVITTTPAPPKPTMKPSQGPAPPATPKPATVGTIAPGTPTVLLKVDFTLGGEVWSADLTVPTSAKYIALAAKVVNVLTAAFGELGFKVLKITVLNFVQSSVKANTEITLQQEAGKDYTPSVISNRLANSNAIKNANFTTGTIAVVTTMAPGGTTKAANNLVTVGYSTILSSIIIGFVARMYSSN